MTANDAGAELPDEFFLVFPDRSETSPSRPTLSFSNSSTILLTFAANRYTRYTSQHYQQEFGIGAMDWRMLVMLAREPGSSVTHASRTIGIDKGAVSRSMKRLEAEGLIQVTSVPHDARQKIWTLTKRGAEIHDDILAASLKRQKQILKNFTQEEVEMLNHYLLRMLKNLKEDTDE